MSVSELLLNSVSLAFITDTDELVFETILPTIVKKLVKETRPLRLPRKPQRLSFVHVRSCGLSVSRLSCSLCFFECAFPVSQTTRRITEAVLALCGNLVGRTGGCWHFHMWNTEVLRSTEDENEDGQSSNTCNDQDSDISFENHADDEIDTTAIEEEEWIEYVKRSTDEAIEKMKNAKIRCWIKTHKKMKWRLALRIASLPSERMDSESC